MRRVYLALLVALPSFAAHGQQPIPIALLCRNTSMVAGDARLDPITGGGMTVNLQERTVSFNSFRVPIERTDGAIVLFHGDQATSYEGLKLTVDGSIDLLSGGVSLTLAQVGNNKTWQLTCQPLGLF
jgi:hypothetical protein